jgi:hypothetical protein
VDLEITKYLGIGATWKYYIKEGDNFYDVTPLRVTTSAGDVTFSATNGSSTITVTDTSHGAVTNDFVTFSGAATLGGLVTAAVLNQEYQIDLVYLSECLYDNRKRYFWSLRLQQTLVIVVTVVVL